jgi:hypothetical protein
MKDHIEDDVRLHYGIIKHREDVLNKDALLRVSACIREAEGNIWIDRGFNFGLQTGN